MCVWARVGVKGRTVETQQGRVRAGLGLRAPLRAARGCPQLILFPRSPSSLAPPVPAQRSSSGLQLHGAVVPAPNHVRNVGSPVSSLSLSFPIYVMAGVGRGGTGDHRGPFVPQPLCTERETEARREKGPTSPRAQSWLEPGTGCPAPPPGVGHPASLRLRPLQ